MSKMKEQFSDNQGDVDIEYKEIEQKQKELSERWGYNVCFEEARMHHGFDKVIGRIEDINSSLRVLRAAASPAVEHPDQDKYYGNGY